MRSETYKAAPPEHAALQRAANDLGVKPSMIRFRATGEYRAPKRGDWFLSGTIVEAWYADRDYRSPTHIAVPIVPFHVIGGARIGGAP